MSNFYLRKDCRLCGSKDLAKVLPLAATALCDAYLKEKREQEVYQLDLFQCKNCGFVQIECVVEPEIIYRDYIYVTTSSSGLSSHFKDYANTVYDYLKLNSNNLVIDIGSNDGTLLSHFKAKGTKVLGIEPSIKIANDATSRGIETLPEFFNAELSKTIMNKYGSADLITINNLYANVDDLKSFTEEVVSVLSNEGVLVIESSYLLDMVDNMVFDFIYHEHLSYFSILPLISFFSKFDMHLICLEHVPTKGGSLRYYWARKTSSHKVDSSVAEFTQKEKEKQMDRHYFEKWNERINKVKSDLIQELDNCKGNTIVGYGASATSTTLIYHFELQKYLSFLIDDNPGKIGTFSPGLHIPIKSIKESELDEYTVLIILAWRFEKEIIFKLKDFKGKILIPLPEFRIG